MTPRNLFNIILKVLGVFFIRDFLEIIPQLLSPFLIFTEPDSKIEAVWTFLTTLIVVLVYGLVAYYLIFKTELIIDKLELEKGFNQEILSINIHRSTVLSISIIVLGGLLITTEIPNLCRQLFLYFQEKRLTSGFTHPSLSSSILSASKILIGVLLIVNQRQLVSLIERQRKK